MRVVRWVTAWTTVAALLAFLPFFVLVRVGTAAVQGWGLGGWTSLGLGALAVAAVLGLYAGVLGWKEEAWAGVWRVLRRGGLGLGGVVLVYGVVWVGPVMAEDQAVRAEYRALHPVLRLAAGPVFLADPGRVVTDPSRTVEDYRLLGLSEAEADLHFVQEDGSVHAVDFHTGGRAAWGNRTVELGFWLLGFHSLRHRGTADHIHVSLRSAR